MNIGYQIPEPLLFNPLKHHLGFIKEFINLKIEDESNADIKNLIKDLKHLGTSVMDVYTGSLSIINICKEVEEFLEQKDILRREPFSLWAGINMNNFKIISLSDSSQWTLKYHNNEIRYVHLFPARSSPHSFRVKSNTLKSALLYYILIGKDFITGDDLNKARILLGLSPIKDTVDTEAIMEMIEILRVSGSSFRVPG
ncbi:MAG: hypothetical protein Q8N38_01350 [Bacteroidales bacterium]|nr:hypothetical protein [Bacteroidales bacterium]